MFYTTFMNYLNKPRTQILVFLLVLMLAFRLLTALLVAQLPPVNPFDVYPLGKPLNMASCVGVVLYSSEIPTGNFTCNPEGFMYVWVSVKGDVVVHAHYVLPKGKMVVGDLYRLFGDDIPRFRTWLKDGFDPRQMFYEVRSVTFRLVERREQ